VLERLLTTNAVDAVSESARNAEGTIRSWHVPRLPRTTERSPETHAPAAVPASAFR
jgi:hypothetical protein